MQLQTIHHNFKQSVTNSPSKSSHTVPSTISSASCGKNNNYSPCIVSSLWTSSLFLLFPTPWRRKCHDDWRFHRAGGDEWRQKIALKEARKESFILKKKERKRSFEKSLLEKEGTREFWKDVPCEWRRDFCF